MPSQSDKIYRDLIYIIMDVEYVFKSRKLQCLLIITFNQNMSCKVIVFLFPTFERESIFVFDRYDNMLYFAIDEHHILFFTIITKM